MTETRKQQALKANHYAHCALDAIEWADKHPLITAELIRRILTSDQFARCVNKNFAEILAKDNNRRAQFVKKLYSLVQEDLITT